MKQFVMRSWKKVCSMLLVLTLSLGGGILWYAEGVSAEETTDLQETSLTFQDICHKDGEDANYIYIRLKVDEGVTVGDGSYYDDTNQIMLDGTIISSEKAYYFNPEAGEDKADILWLIIYYSSFEGATTAEDVKAKTHTVVIPKGSSIGSDLKAKEDVALILNSAGAKPANPVTFSSISGYAADNNSQYVITLSDTGASTWGDLWNDRNCVIDGVMCEDKFGWDSSSGKLGITIKYAALESSNPALAEGVGEHEILFPAGTVIGDMVLLSDCRVEVNGYSITKGPDVVLKSSVYNADTNGAKEVNLQMDQEDNLSLNPEDWISKTFTEGGIYLNGVLDKSKFTFCKQEKESKLYNVFFNEKSLSSGTIMTVDGKIKEDGYYAKFERKHFKYLTNSGWSEYTPTELSIKEIYQCEYQEREDQYVIYMRTSSVVPGNDGQTYCVTVDIGGNSSEQEAQKVTYKGESLWALSVPRKSIPADGTEVVVTVKASKEIMSNQDMSNQDNCEIVTITSDFSFLFWGVLRGDANKDWNLDLKDIVRLICYIGDNRAVPVGKGADAYIDGLYNEADSKKMRYYLLTGRKECSHRVIE